MSNRRSQSFDRCSFLVATALALGGNAWAQVTSRISVDPAGLQANSSSGVPSISADGRYVAFASSASNLVGGDSNGTIDIFVCDRLGGAIVRASVDSLGTEGNQQSNYPSLSGDGRYVAFLSIATNLVAGDTNGVGDVFLHDLLSETTTRVSVDSSGVQANGLSLWPRISADGRFVAFDSIATNLVAADTNGVSDAFVHDLQSGTTTRISVDSSGAEGNNHSYQPVPSGDGRLVTFWAHASNLVLGDTNGATDVFVHDLQTATTTRVSVDSAGSQGNLNSLHPAISGDGRWIAFQSSASTLIVGDTNGGEDVFVHDRQTATTQRVNVSTLGAQVNNQSYLPSISADGRHVAFASTAANLVPGNGPSPIDVFVRDVQAGVTSLVSVSTSGVSGNDNSQGTSLSADGRYIAFDSMGGNLVAFDTVPNRDVFVHDRGTPAFRSLCHPGVEGVAACPCANPPSGPGRGCDNSFLTGGAPLIALGAPYLADDSLVFNSSGEPPTATSILLQGRFEIANGLVFGQGVRCASGMLVRLYVKPASNGEVWAPNFAVGDLPISERSAALGDVIRPGESRFYLIYYRDPFGAGGCAPQGTFNSTQTGKMVWSVF